jgi:hypothetical protein
MLTWIWSRASAWVYTQYGVKCQSNYRTVVAACRVVNLVISCCCSIGSNIGACESPSTGSWRASMGIPPLDCARLRACQLEMKGQGTSGALAVEPPPFARCCFCSSSPPNTVLILLLFPSFCDPSVETFWCFCCGGLCALCLSFSCLSHRAAGKI